MSIFLALYLIFTSGFMFRHVFDNHGADNAVYIINDHFNNLHYTFIVVFDRETFSIKPSDLYTCHLPMQWIENERHSSYEFVCPQFSVFSQAPGSSSTVPSGGPMEQ